MFFAPYCPFPRFLPVFLVDGNWPGFVPTVVHNPANAIAGILVILACVVFVILAAAILMLRKYLSKKASGK